MKMMIMRTMIIIMNKMKETLEHLQIKILIYQIIVHNNFYVIIILKIKYWYFIIIELNSNFLNY